MAIPIDFYIPSDIPPEISIYEAEPGQLGVGKAGKVGILQLKLERDADNRRTVIREQYCKTPLCVQRALYLEETLPAMAYVYIISPSGGILQGDRYRIDIVLSNNSFAHVTTQSATRIYKMEKNFGTQMVNVEVKEGSYFEYIPDQIIPFRNSRFYQAVELNVHDNATMIYSEMLVPGRVARGESFEYDICYIRTRARNQLGKPRFVDMIKLEPKKENLRLEEIMGTFDVVGTMYIITRPLYIKDLQQEINLKINELQETIAGGASAFPNKQGIIVRMLGKTAGEVRNMIFEVIRISRRQIIGASFSGIRKA
ncbi:MAG: urease accessory protein UreD [Nitrososphaeraceae archaeon]